MENVVLLNASKTKNGNVILKYGYKDPKEKYLKGFQVCEQWLNNSDLYDKFTDEDFGVMYDVKFGYEDTYNGNARRVITLLSTSSGEVLFEKR